MDRSRWKKLIKDVWWSGWVWVGGCLCFFWYWPTWVVPDRSSRLTRSGLYHFDPSYVLLRLWLIRNTQIVFVVCVITLLISFWTKRIHSDVFDKFSKYIVASVLAPCSRGYLEASRCLGLTSVSAWKASCTSLFDPLLNSFNWQNSLHCDRCHCLTAVDGWTRNSPCRYIQWRTHGWEEDSVCQCELDFLQFRDI